METSRNYNKKRIFTRVTIGIKHQPIFTCFCLGSLLLAIYWWVWTGISAQLFDPRSWLPFDSAWYHSIAQNGYTYDHLPSTQDNIAFFPIYPYLCKLVVTVTGLPTIAVLYLVSTLNMVLGAGIFYKTIRHVFDSQHVAALSVILYLTYPFSMFLMSAYAESTYLLFIFLAISSLQKEKYRWSAFWAGLATGTRSAGAFFSLALVLYYLIRCWPKKEPGKSIAFQQISHSLNILLLSIISLSGLLSYMLYLSLTFQEPLAFVKTLSAWKYEAPSAINTLTLFHPINQLHGRYKMLPGHLFTMNPLNVPLIASFLFMVNCLLFLRGLQIKLPWYYLVYGFASLIYPIYATSGLSDTALAVGSLGRYQLQCIFPFMVLGHDLARKPYSFALIVILMGVAQLKLTSLFVHNMWAG